MAQLILSVLFLDLCLFLHNSTLGNMKILLLVAITSPSFGTSIFGGMKRAFISLFEKKSEPAPNRYAACQRGGSTPSDAAYKNEKFTAISTGGNSDKPIKVYFVRHAESTWNAHSQKSILHQVGLETGLSLRASESLRADVTDAPLSAEGLKKVQEVAKELQPSSEGMCHEVPSSRCEDLKFLAGNPDAQAGRTAVFAVSNLRRAIMTALMVFENRLPNKLQDAALPKVSPIEKFHILSALQEITSNLDSALVSNPGDLPSLSFGTKDSDTCPFEKTEMEKLFDLSCNQGDENKRFSQSIPAGGELMGDSRFTDFCKWAHYQASKGATDLVLVGHSIWLRKFLQSHYSSTGENRNKKDFSDAAAIKSDLLKLSNEAIASFTLHISADGPCQVPPESFYLVRGEFHSRGLLGKTRFYWGKPEEKKGI
jgi:hypothetical protein